MKYILNSIFSLSSNYRMMSIIFLTLTLVTITTAQTTESVVFHPVDQIYNSISSSIITTAVDFSPYQSALLNGNKYTRTVKRTMLEYYSTFKDSDPRYIQIMNLTLADLDAALEENY